MRGVWSRWLAVVLLLTCFELGLCDNPRTFSLAEAVWSVPMNTWDPALTVASGKAFIFSTNINGVRACSSCTAVNPIVYRVREIKSGGYVADEGAEIFSWTYLDRSTSGSGSNAHAKVLHAVTKEDGNPNNPLLLASYLRNSSIVYQSSTDLGETWTSAVTVSRSGEVAELSQLTVNPNNSNALFISYNAPLPYATSSTDGGQTWSTPHTLDLTESQRYKPCGAVHRQTESRVFFGYTVIGATTSYNRVYSSVDNFNHYQNNNVHEWSSALNQRCPESAHCPVDQQQQQQQEEEEEEDNFFLAGGCALDVDELDTVYHVAVVPSATARNKAVILSLSLVGTSNFSTPIVVYSGDEDTAVAFPTVTCGHGAGDVRVAWMDNRTGLWNVWYRESLDGGKTWRAPEVRVSNYNSFGFQEDSGFLFPYGEAISMEVDARDQTHIVWGEGYGWQTGGTVMYATTIAMPSTSSISLAGVLILTGFFSAFAGVLAGAGVMYWYKNRVQASTVYTVVDVDLDPTVETI